MKTACFIIGNSYYPLLPPNKQLTTPVNDANSISEVFNNMGFFTQLIINEEAKDIITKLTEFVQYIKEQEIESIIIYYSGHAFEIEGENYICTKDTEFVNEESTKYISISLENIFNCLKKNSDIKTKIIILDACRDNPFLEPSRSVNGTQNKVNFDSTNLPIGTLIEFSTSSGKSASDGAIGAINSRFTSSFLKFVSIPGLTIEDIFKKTREDLYESCNQLSWDYSSLRGTYYLIPPTSCNSEDNSDNLISLITVPSSLNKSQKIPELSFNNTENQNIEISSDKKLIETNRMPSVRKIKRIIIEEYPEECYADSTYDYSKSTEIMGIINKLRSYVWTTQNSGLDSMWSLEFDKCSKEDLFILGRNIYQTGCSNSFRANDIFSSFDYYFNSIPKEPQIHILNGLAYEIYFDRNNQLRKIFKTGRLQIILNKLLEPEYIKCANFIQSKLSKYENRVLFNIIKPFEMNFEIICSKRNDVFCISEILYNNKNVMYDITGKSFFVIDEWYHLANRDSIKKDICNKVGALEQYIKVTFKDIPDDVLRFGISDDYQLLLAAKSE